MLRYAAAPLWMCVHRIWSVLSGGSDGFRILLFHDVLETEIPAFTKLMAYVARTHGVISPTEAARRLRGQWPDRRIRRHRLPCLVSFDDGFRSNFDVAQSVLEPLGIRALFFIPPGLMELSGDQQAAAIAESIFNRQFSESSTPRPLRLMTWEEARKLQEQGHVIGCHGLSHNRLSELDTEGIGREVREAKSLMAARLESSTNWYAFAFGDIKSINSAALEIIGSEFEFCRSGIRGENAPAVPHLALRADSISLDSPYAYQRLLVNGGVDGLYISARQRLTEMARNVSIAT